MRRFWRYRYGQWTPSWWEWVFPGHSADEYGRVTLIFHVPFVGFIVWAWRTCYCDDCEQSRAQTAAWQDQ